MQASRRLSLASSVLVFGLFASCGGGAYYARVGYGPPAPLVETPYGLAPGPDYIWAPGYYDWDGGAWGWRHGEWRLRPHSEDRWVAPRWEPHGGRYRFHEGGWQHGGAGGHFHH